MAARMASQRRVISFDLDGVLAAPPFNWNPTINRDLTLTPIEQPPDRRPESCARPIACSPAAGTGSAMSRATRAPGALDAVRAAARNHSVIVLTGRSVRGRGQTQAWLEREGFASHLDRLIVNASTLNSVRHKEQSLAALDVALHIDDDAATAALLAAAALPLRCSTGPETAIWPSPPAWTRYTDMHELAAAIAAMNQVT